MSLRNLFPLCILATAAACGSDLRVPPCGNDPVDPSALQLRLEPHSDLNDAPRALRIHVDAPDGVSLDPEQFFLFSGTISSAQLGQLARDDMSLALAERLVATTNWAHSSGVTIAPDAVLDVGQDYAVASGAPKMSGSLTVREEGLTPLLQRLWPVPDRSASHGIGAWCSTAEVPAFEAAISLAPIGVAGGLQTGAITPWSGRRCIHLVAQLDPFELSGPLLVPPSIDTGSGELALDPRPLLVDAVHEPVDPLVCPDNQVSFGPGCAEVLDDRMVITPPTAPLLWSISGKDIDQVVVTLGNSERFIVSSLPPAQVVALEVQTLDNAGNSTTSTFAAKTQSLMAHVVINEVMANPVGPEPQQEWVELYNDGQAHAQLDGYILIDIGGETLLPPAILGAGQYAVLVNDDFDETSSYDPMPPSGVKLLRVAKLGKGGLNNQGEPLELHDAGGNQVSAFPPLPKPKSGASIIRVEPDAPDGVSGSFVRSDTPTPGAPNSAETAL